jgi:hypothetical protein
MSSKIRAMRDSQPDINNNNTHADILWLLADHHLALCVASLGELGEPGKRQRRVVLDAVDTG